MELQTPRKITNAVELPNKGQNSKLKTFVAIKGSEIDACSLSVGGLDNY